MDKANVYVVPDGNYWSVKYKSNILNTYDTQQKAVDYGKTVAKSYKTDLCILGRDGKIRERNSYGPDPRNVHG